MHKTIVDEKFNLYMCSFALKAKPFLHFDHIMFRYKKTLTCLSSVAKMAEILYWVISIFHKLGHMYCKFTISQIIGANYARNYRR
jgi:hypothetical protein